jgi:type I restriction enzyme S subunit
MSFPRYESYKESGVEWLGDVPEHWRVAALERGFDVRLGKMLQSESSSPEDELLPYLRAANIHWSGVNVSDIKQMWFSQKERGQLALLPDDLLISEGGDVGRSAFWCGEIDNCHFQNSVNRVRAKEGNSNRYLYYWISVIKDKGYIDVLCNKSTIAHFTAEKVQAVPVPFPPSAEQQTIAAFLDRETAKIDALIAEQQRLIELLKEKRQSVISHAVTKGLNPNAPMKDSGIEWLGEVPEHWDVTRLGFLCKKIGSGKTLLGGSETYTDSGVVFIRSQNVYDEGLRLDDVVYISEQTDSEMYWSRVISGDILLNITGASLGRTCLVPDNFEPANVNQHVCIIRFLEARLGSYIAMVLKSSCLKAQIDAAQTGAAREGLNFWVISKLTFALPPISEQQTIAAFLERETAKLDTLTTEAKTAITLLQERRTALISAAVTGKIDVRSLVTDKS